MKKQLNIPLIEAKSEQFGLNQSQIAEMVGVSRQAVTKWYQKASFPRPAQLLKLGKLLKLAREELVQSLEPREDPMIAFRKRAGTVTTDEHRLRAKNMGYFLRPLVPYFTFDRYKSPSQLKEPSLEYDYLQGLVIKVREEIGIEPSEVLNFDSLIQTFKDHQAVIIPTLWGKKSSHENALHIFLPDSQTTWVYLNLDSNIHDFKFWMAHELAHVLTLELLEQNKHDFAEDFADAFAGALLFPATSAAALYTEYSNAETAQERLKCLLKVANEHVISPLSVFKELEKFASHNNLPLTKIKDETFHAVTTNFNNSYANLSSTILETEDPTADEYFTKVGEVFKSDFFTNLAKYLKEKEADETALINILNVSPMDAKAYYEALVK